MTKKKGPQMVHTHPAEQALVHELDSLIDGAAEGVDESELEDRERKANEVVENVRARVSRRDRA
jgi:hypothetical protein